MTATKDLSTALAAWRALSEEQRIFVFDCLSPSALVHTGFRDAMSAAGLVLRAAAESDSLDFSLDAMRARAAAEPEAPSEPTLCGACLCRASRHIASGACLECECMQLMPEASQ